jgi:5-methylcytosine-specific restriction endonuclease McrA
LNLTNLALAQKLFVLEKKSGHPMTTVQKAQVLANLENKSTREAEKIVFEIKPEMKGFRKELGFNDIEDDGLRDKLLQAKGLFAHTHPNMSLNELLHKLCDQALEKKTKVSRAPKMNSRAEIERQVWRRDGQKCTNCQSTHAVQVEHIIPAAAGGPFTLENLCLLCRSCNQRRAIEYFGLPKMDKYLNGSVPGSSDVSVSEKADRITVSRAPKMELQTSQPLIKPVLMQVKKSSRMDIN